MAPPPGCLRSCIRSGWVSRHTCRRQSAHPPLASRPPAQPRSASMKRAALLAAGTSASSAIRKTCLLRHVRQTDLPVPFRSWMLTEGTSSKSMPVAYASRPSADAGADRAGQISTSRCIARSLSIPNHVRTDAGNENEDRHQACKSYNFRGLTHCRSMRVCRTWHTQHHTTIGSIMPRTSKALVR
jgi:hypothetical protein